MFEQTIAAGEAMRDAAEGSPGTLIPALCGCFACQTTQMIATPALGACSDCGTDLEVLSGKAGLQSAAIAFAMRVPVAA